MIKLVNIVGSGDAGTHLLFHAGVCNHLVDDSRLLFYGNIRIQDKPVSKHILHKCRCSAVDLLDQGIIRLPVMGSQNFKWNHFTVFL